ncbi:uncharacterized protein TNCV_1428911 [Trichonephila clavipes]|nr:uncharacterized protein TNCV_1428911 [Trichonephila clavipes]
MMRNRINGTDFFTNIYCIKNFNNSLKYVNLEGLLRIFPNVDGWQERARPCQLAGGFSFRCPRRDCSRVSAADKGCRVNPLDRRPDAVALYSGCTPDSPVTISPHKTLNSCRGVISEYDLLTAPDAEILDGFSDQGVIQVRRLTIKKEASFIPTKHLILTFNRPKLPTTIKAGYLNCKIRPYILNPLRSFKCQRFGHSQTS